VRFSFAAIALAVVVQGPDIHAQRVENYPTLVRMYAAGSGAEALSALLRYPHRAIIETAKSTAPTLAPREMIAAAILHTEAALSVLDARPFDATAHVELSKALIESALRHPAAHEQALTVARRWYYFVVSMFASANQMQAANWYAREGLIAFPREATLYFVRGTIAEMSMHMAWDRDLRHELPETSRERGRLELYLKNAVDDYQRALNIDAHLARAHLHVGWTRLFLGDKRARVELEAAAADARTDRERYLAHLFLGGLAEHDKRLEDARREYQAAHEAGPAFQSGYLALSRVEEALGNSRRAQDLAVECAQLRKDDPDPWWDYAVNFDRDALIDLRAEARRP